MGDQEGIREGIGLTLVSNGCLQVKTSIQLNPEAVYTTNLLADTLKYIQGDALWYSVPRFLYDPEEVLERNLVKKGEKTKCLLKQS